MIMSAHGEANLPECLEKEKTRVCIGCLVEKPWNTVYFPVAEVKPKLVPILMRRKKYKTGTPPEVIGFRWTSGYRKPSARCRDCWNSRFRIKRYSWHRRQKLYALRPKKALFHGRRKSVKENNEIATWRRLGPERYRERALKKGAVEWKRFMKVVFPRPKPRCAIQPKAIATERVSNFNHDARERGGVGSIGVLPLRWLHERSPGCFYCGKDVRKVFHFDHKIPLAVGGSHTIENIAIACPPCNIKKRTMTDVEFKAQMEVVYA